MSSTPAGAREGSIDAPTRHPIDWKSAEFQDESRLMAELERVFDICHGCRRCVSLCQSFPTLFDLVDESATMEVDGVAKANYWKVVDQCYLCDLCYQTKCPYVPPHEWNVDYPHLMLRAKAIQHRKGEVSTARKLLASTTAVGKLASLPLVVQTVNAANRNPTMRGLLEQTLGVDRRAAVPQYHYKIASKRLRDQPAVGSTQVAGPTRGKVAVFVTCYGEYNRPQIVEDLVAVLRHNRIPTQIITATGCCGMPKMELGDLSTVERYLQRNLPILTQLVDEGFDLTAPIPSCVLMFKQELPLLFADIPEVQKVQAAFFDPFEYLMQRHKAGLLNTEFPHPLGTISYHVPCHQRVQKIGPKTRDVLALVPGTELDMIERCSGHDGTYGVRHETYDHALKIVKPVLDRINRKDPDHVASDCPMAADHIAHNLGGDRQAEHPVSLLRRAYGI